MGNCLATAWSHLTLCKVITTHPLCQASVKIFPHYHPPILQDLINPANCPVLTSEPTSMESLVSILTLFQSLRSASGIMRSSFFGVLAHQLTTLAVALVSTFGLYIPKLRCMSIMFCFLFIFHKDLELLQWPFPQWDTSSVIFSYLCRLCLFAVLSV